MIGILHGVFSLGQLKVDGSKGVAMKLASRVYLLETGRIVAAGTPEHISEDQSSYTGKYLKPKMAVTATVYNTRFALDRDKDLLWGDEAGK